VCTLIIDNILQTAFAKVSDHHFDFHDTTVTVVLRCLNKAVNMHIFEDLMVPVLQLKVCA
jgi:hypothetical protein